MITELLHICLVLNEIYTTSLQAKNDIQIGIRTKNDNLCICEYIEHLKLDEYHQQPNTAQSMIIKRSYICLDSNEMFTISTLTKIDIQISNLATNVKVCICLRMLLTFATYTEQLELKEDDSLTDDEEDMTAFICKIDCNNKLFTTTIARLQVLSADCIYTSKRGEQHLYANSKASIIGMLSRLWQIKAEEGVCNIISALLVKQHSQRMEDGTYESIDTPLYTMITVAFRPSIGTDFVAFLLRHNEMLEIYAEDSARITLARLLPPPLTEYKQATFLWDARFNIDAIIKPLKENIEHKGGEVYTIIANTCFGQIV